MEMISLDTAIYGIVAVLSILVGAIGLATLDRWLMSSASRKQKPRDLAQEATRDQLNEFLKKHLVFGDADIRDGIVYPPVAADKIDPLAVVLMNAANMAIRHRGESKAADSLILLKDDGSGVLLGLDADHVLDAARVIQRVAEDRKKSRSIYKGLSDDEIKAIVRTGLSHWLISQKRFSAAEHVREGGWDTSDQFLGAFAAVEFLLSLKGRSND